MKLWLHTAWYRLLYAIGLGRAFNTFLCRLGCYHQYQPGVCGWCGARHVKSRRIKMRRG